MGDDLVRRMIDASEMRGDFVLSSGKRSSVYFDKFLFLTDPDLLDELASEVASTIPPGVDRIGAPEGAAMLLASAVALKTRLPITVVRKEPKAYGTRSQVEGSSPAGSRIALIEDVGTTGQQVAKAAKLLEEAGAKIEMIVLAIDRGGADHLKQLGYRVHAVAVMAPD